MAFAETTSVSPERTRAEIEKLLSRYKAENYGYGSDAAKALIMFTVAGRRIRFVLRLPDPKDKRFHSGRGWKTQISANRYDQEIRRLWRALLLTIKAKLEAAESGIETFEEAFMAHIVMPDGRAFSEVAMPAITSAYETGRMPPLMLGMGEP